MRASLVQQAIPTTRTQISVKRKQSMARPKKTDRPVEKNISLPQSVVVRVELELFSELEGKVPFGAWQRYIVRLVEADLAKREAKSS